MLSNGSLSVSEVYMEDSGLYGCTAKNGGGSQRAELHLHVTSMPMSYSYSSDALYYQAPASCSIPRLLVASRVAMFF